MQYGICSNPEMSHVATRAGFDFLEWSVGGLLKPTEDHESFAAALKEARAAELPYPVVNRFVPGGLRITGLDADLSVLERYVTTTFQRAREAGVKVIVFGSGGARRIPDGFDPKRAHAQITAFCRMLAPIALDHGVTVVVEPLNQKECNILTTVGECAALVREVDHPAVRLLVDAYHLLKDNDSLQDIANNGDLLSHVHVATVPNRLPPGAEACDLLPFFDALVQARYDGRVSIEGRISDAGTELPGAISLMKALERKAKNRSSNQGIQPTS